MRCSVTIYTDGACSKNGSKNAIGGYGAILKFGDHEKVVRGYAVGATNNRMELMAVIAAIGALKKPCDVQVITDSQYVIQGGKSMRKWLDKKDFPNKELWLQLIEAGNKGGHKIRFVKVAGHTGDVYNERCDCIAREQIRKVMQG
jgi:ribonuclease HI